MKEQKEGNYFVSCRDTWDWRDRNGYFLSIMTSHCNNICLDGLDVSAAIFTKYTLPHSTSLWSFLSSYPSIFAINHQILLLLCPGSFLVHYHLDHLHRPTWIIAQHPNKTSLFASSLTSFQSLLHPEAKTAKKKQQQHQKQQKQQQQKAHLVD